MTRATVLQEVRQIRFEELYERRQRREVTMAEAGEMLGVTERTFHRWSGRTQESDNQGQILCCAYRCDRLPFMARPTLSQLFHARSRTAPRTADEAIRRAHLKHGYRLFEIDRPWPTLSDDQPHRASPESQ